MKKMRLGFVILLFGLTIGIFGFRDQLFEQPKEMIRVAMIPKIIGISYFDKCMEGAKEVAQKYGMEIIYKGPTTADAAIQVNLIQDFIYQKVDVIAIAPIDPNAVKPILQEARKKGIIVVTFDADADPEARDVFVNQVSPEVLGQHLMDNLVGLIGEEGQFAILTASLTADNQNTWIHYMEAYRVSKYPNLELLTMIPTDEDQQKAYANTRNLLQAYPEIDGIIAMSTEAGPGAAQAFKTLNIREEVKLYALALPNEMNSYLHEGYAQLATLWNPYDLGRLTMEVVHRLMEGEVLEDGQSYPNFGPIKYDEVSHTLIMGQPLDFDKANVDAYDF
ncbi:MAG: autoinducer 2 ABC transporter substrate-binding protein [Vallitaleaceae bacterium]|nr:autoinducer 2 ABC transporter substrate-binding protein [Vallitaleaceae bacterium]